MTPGVVARRPERRRDRHVPRRSRRPSSTKCFRRRTDVPLLCHVREVDIHDTELANGDDDGFLAVVHGESTAAVRPHEQRAGALSRVPDQPRRPARRAAAAAAVRSCSSSRPTSSSTYRTLGEAASGTPIARHGRRRRGERGRAATQPARRHARRRRRRRERESGHDVQLGDDDGEGGTRGADGAGRRSRAASCAT